MDHWGCAARLGDGDLGRVTPQRFKTIVVARLGSEDVHDDRAVVHEDPGALVAPLGAPEDGCVVVCGEVTAETRPEGLAGGYDDWIEMWG